MQARAASGALTWSDLKMALATKVLHQRCGNGTAGRTAHATVKVRERGLHNVLIVRSIALNLTANASMRDRAHTLGKAAASGQQ